MKLQTKWDQLLSNNAKKPKMVWNHTKNDYDMHGSCPMNTYNQRFRCSRFLEMLIRDAADSNMASRFSFEDFVEAGGKRERIYFPIIEINNMNQNWSFAACI